MASGEEWDNVLLGNQKTPNIMSTELQTIHLLNIQQSFEIWYQQNIEYLKQPNNKHVLSILNALYDEINVYKTNDNTSVVRAVLYTWHIYHIKHNGVEPHLYRLIQLFIDNMTKQNQLDPQGIKIVWSALMMCNKAIYHAPPITTKCIIACECQPSLFKEMSQIPVGSYYTYPTFLHGKIDTTFYMLQNYIQKGVSYNDNVIFLRITDQVKFMYNPVHLTKQSQSHDVIFCMGMMLHKIGPVYYEYYNINQTYQEFMQAGNLVCRLGFGKKNKIKNPFTYAYKYGLKWMNSDNL